MKFVKMGGFVLLSRQLMQNLIKFINLLQNYSILRHIENFLALPTFSLQL